MRFSKLYIPLVFCIASTANAEVPNAGKHNSDRTEQQLLRDKFEQKHRQLEPKPAERKNTGDGQFQDYPVQMDDTPNMSENVTSAASH